MPTANDYYQASIGWGDAAYQCDTLAAELAWSLPESRLGHCPVRIPLDNAIGVGVQNLERSAREFDELRDECLRRVKVCLDYDDAMGRYRSELARWSALPEAERGTAPREPLRTHRWVEASS